jgi:hypothetical protein
MRETQTTPARRWRSAAGLAVVAAALVAGPGCGDDSEATPPATIAKPPTPPGTAAGAKIQLPEKLHIEDRVGCAIPDRPSDPVEGKCDLKAPSCGEHLYCLQLAQGSYCEPCAERDGIRHAFKDRDFTDQNRDPFQSFLLLQIPTDPKVPVDTTVNCRRSEQMIATGYSYSDLKLVGIISQGTQFKVLMMGGPLGYIIKRGDCVGKEKAVVKDIGTGYVTFQVAADQTSATARAPEEYSIQLNPKQLLVNEPELPVAAPRTSITPVVPPPATLPGQAPVRAVAPPAQPTAVAPGAGSGSAAAGAGSAAVVAPPIVAPPVEAPLATPKRSFVPAETTPKR